MTSNYKKIGTYIKPVNNRNADLNIATLLGVNIDKFFMPSVANIIGTDMTAYKVVKKGQFACNRMHVGRDYRLPVALSSNEEDFLVSPAYDVFEIYKTEELLPEYLMMWFSRSEFDRNAWFYTDVDVRGGLNWKAFCNMDIPIPSIQKQKEIVKEYNVLVDRINLNNQLIKKLEQTAQAVYKQWFVDFEFPNENGNPYKLNGGKMDFNEELNKEIPKGWEIKKLNKICSIKYGKNLPTEKLIDKGYYVFGGNGIIGRYKDYIYEKAQVIIACRGAASGKINISYPRSYITNNSIVFENNSVEFSYLKYFCLNNSFESYVTGSAQPQITIDNIKDVSLLWPSSDTLLTQFSKIIINMDEFHFNRLIENEKLLEFRNMILSKMSSIKK